MKICYTFILATCFLTVLLSPATAQHSKGLFEGTSILTLNLTTDIQKIQADRDIDPKYHDAKIAGISEDGTTYDMKVQVKARGNFRRSDGTCIFPPLRVRFSKNDTLGPFEGNKKLKLVTHCQKDEYILREYMIYKVFQQLTEHSLRVRLCKITYHDSEEVLDPETHYAFFIESVESVAERLGGQLLPEDSVVSFDQIHREQLTLVHVFQYMIGNPDHSPERQKNTKLIYFNDPEKPLLPIPYDFDFSLAVDASYTKLGAGKLFSKRRFKRLCRSEEEFLACFERLEGAKKTILTLYKEDSLLNKESKGQATKCIKDFFKIIKSSKKVKEVFLDSCK